MAAKRKKIRLTRKIALWEAGSVPGYAMLGQEPPCIDAFSLVEKEPVAAVLICPGGAYGHLAEHERAPVAQWLNSLGYAAFVLHYRVAPYRHPYPLADARRAMCHIRYYARNYGVRPDRIGILGFSAGGHLAASLATREDCQGIDDDMDPVERMPSRPDFMILGYPVVTFGERYAHAETARNLIGHDPDPAERDAFSIEKNVHGQTPPAFLWHTAEDRTVPVQHSLMLAGALTEAGVPVELHIFPQGAHGLGLAQGTAAGAWTQMCAAWLARQI